MTKQTLPIRPRRLRRLIVTAVVTPIIGIAVFAAAPDAEADGVIDDAEFAYIAAYHNPVCATLDAFPTPAGVAGVMQGIHEDGFSYDSTVDIINASVESYCYRHWPLLQAIGRAARGEQVA